MGNKWKYYLFVTGLIVLATFSNSLFFTEDKFTEPLRIKGFNLVAPPDPFSIDSLQNIKNLGADWVSIVPYAFCNAKTAEITFDHPRQWWGEKPEGVIETIQMVKSLGLKVMLKPHLWVGGQGWAGDLDFESDSLWLVFERQYDEYIGTYAKIADSMKVELYCIGTEMRNSTKKRNDYWIDLISKTQQVYKGKLTYASNWDEFNLVQFWSDLDFIGIDAYFPLSERKTPAKNELVEAWDKPKRKIKAVAEKFNKPILFTEYGYESIDYNTKGHWQLSKDSLNVNFENQKTAFEALYLSFNGEKWWHGGFIWKWHLNINGLNKRNIKAYTPQGKPALKIIETTFKTDI